MRVNQEMMTHRMKVRKMINDGNGYNRAMGNFMLNGSMVNRNTIEDCRSGDISKILYCGTCGSVLSTSMVASCTKCCQRRVDPYDNQDAMAQLVEDWQRREVEIQYNPHRRIVKRVDLTDDVSSVTSGALSAREEWDRYWNESKLSQSERTEVSHSKELPYPGDIDDKFRRHLSGIGMQEPWEKVYSQGERLWLPSRANLIRTDNIANTTVRIRSPQRSPIRSRGHSSSSRQSLSLDTHKVSRDRSAKSMRHTLRREPSLR